MAIRRHLGKYRWLLRLMGLSIAGVLVIASVVPKLASAQSTSGSWSVPLNLSHSGSATNPAIIIDSNEVIHAVWLDNSTRYTYSRFDGTQWSEPEQTNLHLLFGLPENQPSSRETEAPIYPGLNPLFVNGPGRFITAFWLTPNGLLYTSHVVNREFKNIAAWEGTKPLSASAAYFSVAVDSSGELHIAYFRTADNSGNSAGIYYRHTKNRGMAWSSPMLLYESPYFRSLDGGEANLSIATAGTADTPRVYIAWDNRARKQVLLARSMDGGRNWEEPVEIAGPAPDSGIAGPLKIQVGAMENSTVLVWQSTNQEGSCTLFFESSSDTGATWSQPQPMAKELLGCAQANEFVANRTAAPGDFLYLMTENQSRVFLSVWNGSEWSKPQEQPTLSGFEDPEIYTRVQYGCRQATLFTGRLYTVGCDQGGGGDIWITSLDLGSAESWFSPSGWSQPEPVYGDEFDATAIDLTATEDNYIHAVFSQRQDSAIYYSRWDGTDWSRITPVLQLPDGETGWPAIASGPGNELFLLARGSRGSLYFSRAKSQEAVTESGWSEAVRIPIVQDGLVTPADVAWDHSGVIYVVYSVPANDKRGVYFIQSKDHGETWSDPIQVFDGTAGFDLVGSPTLMTSSSSRIYITWRQYSPEVDGVSQPIALYSAYSEDAGHTFSTAEPVVNVSVTWGAIGADSNGDLHRLWQRQNQTGAIWNQVSSDGGHSWQDVQLLPAEVGTVTIMQDPDGRLHLIGTGIDSLSHWLWEGNRWQAEAPIRWTLAVQGEDPIELLAAAANKAGNMVAIFARPVGTGDLAQRKLYYSIRKLDLAPEQSVIQKTIISSNPIAYTRAIAELQVLL